MVTFDAKKYGKLKSYSNCVYCNELFGVGTRQPNKKTCSSECAKKHLSAMKIGVKMQSRGGRVEVTCSYCNGSFELWRNDLKEVNFCSRVCSASRPEFKQKVAITGLKNKGKKISPEDLAKRNFKKGESHHLWKGGISLRNRKGNYKNYKIKYVRCPEEYKEMARKDGYVMEHRLNVAISLNRTLSRVEVVHHIDHNPENNNINNLMLFKNNSEHKKYEFKNTI